MKTETKYWIQYISPGSFFSEEWSKPCEPHTNPRDVEWPDNAYAFKLMKREDAVNGEKRYTGDAEQIGPTYYHPDSKIETLAEVRKNPKSTNILIRNMECNDWDALIWTRWGNCPQPYDAEKLAIAS